MLQWLCIFELLLPLHLPSYKGDWAQAPGESSVNIIVSSYDTTHLQENPQRLG